MGGEERRRGIRTSTQLVALVKHLATGKVRRWLTKNLSGVGVCLVADESLERGTRLEVEVTLPDYPTPLAVMGEVVWLMTVQPAHKSYEVPKVELGVRFIDPPQKTQSLLDAYARMTALPADLP